MALNANNAADKFVGIVVLVLIVSSLFGLLLTSLTNLSGSGIALAVLFTTVIPILIAVAVYKAVQNMAK